MNNFLTNWRLARIIRLTAGLGIGIYALVSKDYLFLILAGIFLLQASLNTSCCGGGRCASSDKTDQKQLYKEIIKPYNPNKK